MKTKYKYIFIMLEERNGGYEYLHRSVAKIEGGEKFDAEITAQEYAEKFYSLSEPDKADGGYYFYGGEVFVRLDYWKFITEEEYNVLKNYL